MSIGTAAKTALATVVAAAVLSACTGTSPAPTGDAAPPRDTAVLFQEPLPTAPVDFTVLAATQNVIWASFNAPASMSGDRISLDGGRARPRTTQRGPGVRPGHNGRRPFELDWREPRVLTIDVLGEGADRKRGGPMLDGKWRGQRGRQVGQRVGGIELAVVRPERRQLDVEHCRHIDHARRRQGPLAEDVGGDAPELRRDTRQLAGGLHRDRGHRARRHHDGVGGHGHVAGALGHRGPDALAHNACSHSQPARIPAGSDSCSRCTNTTYDATDRPTA